MPRASFPPGRSRPPTPSLHRPATPPPVPNDASPLGPTDVSCWVGGYPFRHVPHPDPEVLVRVLAREGIAAAWVGSLPAVFHRDPAHANAELVAALAPH